MFSKRLLPFILLLLFLSSCATSDLTLSESAEKDYYKAESLMAEEFYGRANLYLGKFNTKYPYSRFATPAELLQIKAAYLNDEYILSEVFANRFLEAHPIHPELDYVEYILGMSYFQQSESENHEQVFSKKARKTFEDLLQRNPDNIYASEVTENLQLIINRIAEHEMIIGKFYFDHEYYVGAANRFIVVKNDFLKSDIAPESLYWLAASYIELKQHDYAQEVITTLSQQFSGNTWQKKAENLM